MRNDTRNWQLPRQSVLVRARPGSDSSAAHSAKSDWISIWPTGEALTDGIFDTAAIEVLNFSDNHPTNRGMLGGE
ncbi:MAG: hypothetical protein ACI814_003315 [Mariniblastus sp.]|jgi:hypothetical protein